MASKRGIAGHAYFVLIMLQLGQVYLSVSDISMPEQDRRQRPVPVKEVEGIHVDR